MKVKELIAAATAVIADVEQVREAWRTEGEKAAYNLAKYTLATVKDDDDEPIDIWWMKSNYKANMMHDLNSFLFARVIVIKFSEGICWLSLANGIGLSVFAREIKTRGQLRRLLESLGVEE